MKSKTDCKILGCWVGQCSVIVIWIHFRLHEWMSDWSGLVHAPSLEGFVLLNEQCLVPHVAAVSLGFTCATAVMQFYYTGWCLLLHNTPLMNNLCLGTSYSLPSFPGIIPQLTWSFSLQVSMVFVGSHSGFSLSNRAACCLEQMHSLLKMLSGKSTLEIVAKNPSLPTFLRSSSVWLLHLLMTGMRERTRTYLLDCF